MRSLLVARTFRSDLQQTWQLGANVLRGDGLGVRAAAWDNVRVSGVVVSGIRSVFFQTFG